MTVDPWLLERLACPLDGAGLAPLGMGQLCCPQGHRFPVVHGVPVLLNAATDATLWVRDASLQAAREAAKDPWQLDTLGVSADEKAALSEQLAQPRAHPVDPVAAFLVAATNGIAYKHLIGRLPGLPIPDLRLPPGGGAALLDIGCSWGRWTVAAARRGYRPIGIDPSLGAVLAAQRIARGQGLEAHFVVGDARQLPVRAQALDTVFSYSVLQHFSRHDAAQAVREIGRVLKAGGRSLVQMPTVFGLRCLWHQARRRFREPGPGFDVRYWTVPALRRLFTQAIGDSTTAVDCFFGIGLQPADLPLMPPTHRAAIRTSEWLRKASQWLPMLKYTADSVYVQSTKAATP